MEYIVNFNKSNEGIPYLTILRKDMFSLNGYANIMNTITGDRAVELWDELTKRAKKEE